MFLKIDDICCLSMLDNKKNCKMYSIQVKHDISKFCTVPFKSIQDNLVFDV